ncbi:hypothetical protein ACFX16_035547 [Malus domestica]
MDDPTAPPRTPSSSSSQLNTPPQPALLRPVHAQQLYLATSTAPPVPEVSGRRISESNRIRPDGESPHQFGPSNCDPLQPQKALSLSQNLIEDAIRLKSGHDLYLTAIFLFTFPLLCNSATNKLVNGVSDLI